MACSTTRALARFRSAYSEMLSAAAALSASLEQATGTAPAMPPLVRRIRELVCTHYQLPVQCLNGRTKETYHVEARHVAIALCHAFAPMPQQRLGEIFGRNHSMVLHAVRAVRDRQQTDRNFAATFETLFARVRAALPVKVASPSTDD